jgi:uncharacterized protein YcsI (UPF0317 family)
MTQINRLSATDSLENSDQIPIFDQSNGDARKSSLSLFKSWLQDNLTFPGAGISTFVTQRSAPSSTGFSVQINDDANNTHLILTPTAGFAAGTIVLPAIANVVDKQEVLVNCTQQVTSLTVDGNGATAVTGEPSSIGADDFFRLKYDAGTNTWYRVG